jgi:hypothetical protein
LKWQFQFKFVLHWTHYIANDVKTKTAVTFVRYPPEYNRQISYKLL